MAAPEDVTGGPFGEGASSLLDLEIYALIDEELARQAIPRQGGGPAAEAID